MSVLLYFVAIVALLRRSTVIGTVVSFTTYSTLECHCDIFVIIYFSLVEGYACMLACVSR